MTVLSDLDIEASGIKITPLDADNPLQGASYDLRIGDEVLLWSSQKVVDPSGEIMYLCPGDIAVIKTLEYLEMPMNVCGMVHSLVGMVSLGLSQVATTVDPGFKGHLVITMTNYGRVKYPIIYRQPFCTIVFLETKSPARRKFSKTTSLNKLLSVYTRHHRPLFEEAKEELLMPEKYTLETLDQESKWRRQPFRLIYDEIAKAHDDLDRLRADQTTLSKKVSLLESNFIQFKGEPEYVGIRIPKRKLLVILSVIIVTTFIIMLIALRFDLQALTVISVILEFIAGAAAIIALRRGAS